MYKTLTGTSATFKQYDREFERCREVFLQKSRDYGTSWRILRLSSLVDQIFIKARRLRTIEEQGRQKVHDGKDTEYRGIINYCIIALIQLDHGYTDEDTELTEAQLIEYYDYYRNKARELMKDKNHDYGEAWRDMLLSSLTDMILAKLLRMHEIIKKGGRAFHSEGLDANLYDMINYAVFALIRLNEKNNV